MEKLQTISKAVQLLSDGDTVMVGGFGLCGTPFSLIDALAEQDKARNLTVISNNLGEPGRGLGKLLLSGHLKKAIGSYFTTNVDAVEAYNRGELDIELFPKGRSPKRSEPAVRESAVFTHRLASEQNWRKERKFEISMGRSTCLSKG